MQIKQGLELVKQIEEGYLQIEKLYSEFERVTREQTDAIVKGDFGAAAKLIFQRHAVIEQIEARTAAIDELKQQIVDGFYTIKEFNFSSLKRTFGEEAVSSLVQVVERLQSKIKELLELDAENQELLKGQLLNTQRQRQHLAAGKKMLEAYKKPSLIDARFVDKKK